VYACLHALGVAEGLLDALCFKGYAGHSSQIAADRHRQFLAALGSRFAPRCGLQCVAHPLGEAQELDRPTAASSAVQAFERAWSGVAGGARDAAQSAQRSTIDPRRRRRGEAGHVTPHVLRRTTGTALPEAGVPVATAAAILGHSVQVNHRAYVKAHGDALERDRAREALVEVGLGRNL
jgi:hypothetical protein